MPKPEQYILGIDPGYGRVGFGIIQNSEKGWKYVEHGCIETPKNLPFINRLDILNKEFKKIIRKFPISYASIEDLFFCKNITTAIKVSHARGVLMLALFEAKLPVFEFTPLQIKQALVGYGRAEKRQVQKMVEIVLGKIPKGNDDAVDALAIALTLSSSIEFLKKSKH